MLALLGRELHEDAFALRVLEVLAVALEEPVGSALAPDADHQRLAVVDDLPQPLGALGEQPVGRPLEVQEGGIGLDVRILGPHLLVARLERRQMLLFLGREALEHPASPSVSDQPGAPGIELEAAALGRDGDAQGVAGEHLLGGGGGTRRAFSALAILAGPVDLHHALPRLEAAGLGDLGQEHLHVGAEELGRPVAGLADQVEVPGMAVRVLEAETALAEVDPPGDAGVDHPLQRAIDGGPADALVFLAHQVDEVVGAQVAFLAQEDPDHEVAFAGALAARRPQAFDVVCLRVHGTRAQGSYPRDGCRRAVGHPWPSTSRVRLGRPGTGVPSPCSPRAMYPPVRPSPPDGSARRPTNPAGSLRLLRRRRRSAAQTPRC